MKKQAASIHTVTDPLKGPGGAGTEARKGLGASGGYTLFHGRKVLLLFLCVLAVLFAVNLTVVLAPVVQEGTTAEALDGETTHPSRLLETYQRRVLIVTVAVYLVFAVCGIWVIQRVLMPISRIHKTAREIADGNLQNLVSGRYERSLGHLGGTINDIAMNLQEILMLAWNNARRNANTADRIANRYSGEISEAAGELRGIAENLRTMEGLVQEYDFYHVQLDSGTVIDPEAEKSAGKRSGS